MLAIGAWLNMQAAGEGLAHIKSSVAGATAAARGAVDRDDTPAAAAPAPPAAPPVETPAAIPPEPPSEPIEPDDAPRAS